VEAAAIEEVGVVGGSADVRRGGGGTSSAVGGWRAGPEMTVSQSEGGVWEAEQKEEVSWRMRGEEAS
jgi:hypothetical protein